MTTVGFGDMLPATYKEAFIVAFIEIFGAMIVAYNINEIGGIVGAMRNSHQALQRKLGVLRRMELKNPISDELGQKIESYLNHETEIKEEYEYDEHKEIIESLPEQLQKEYYYESNR